MNNSIKIIPIVHKGQKRISLRFPFNQVITKHIKNIPGRKWSKTLKCWHIPYMPNVEEYLLSFLPGKFLAPASSKPSFIVNKKKYDPGNDQYKTLSLYKEVLELRKLSPRTREIYYGFFKPFVYDHRDRDISGLQYHEIFFYVKKHCMKLNNTQKKQLIAAIKFYYERVLGRDRMFFNLKDQVNFHAAPTFIEFITLRQIIDPIHSPHDKLLLFLAYHLTLIPEQIAALNWDCEENLAKNSLINGKQGVVNYLNELLTAHKQALGEQQWLFEKNQEQLTKKDIKARVFDILRYYRLDEIYRSYFRNLLFQAEYSEVTRKNYLSSMMNFIRSNGYKHPALFSFSDLRNYLARNRHMSEFFQNRMINIFHFYYEDVLERKIPWNYLVRPKSARTLPDVFSRDEMLHPHHQLRPATYQKPDRKHPHKPSRSSTPPGSSQRLNLINLPTISLIKKITIYLKKCTSNR